ncbi:hypothetical protein K458DRAFT_318145, partial [Lentithecium fluviatile CBS 122367]
YQKFFRRSWFHRQWVIQEVVLAKDVQILCGQHQMSFSNFVTGHLLHRRTRFYGRTQFLRSYVATHDD